MKQFASNAEFEKWIDHFMDAETEKYPNTEQGMADMLLNYPTTKDVIEALKAEGYDLNDITANGDPYCLKDGDIIYTNRR